MYSIFWQIYEFRNQGYDFSTDYVNNEEASAVPIQTPGIVGLPSSIGVATGYDHQAGKIVVPSDLPGIQPLPNAALASFPAQMIVQDIADVPIQKVNTDSKRRRPKVFQCSFDGCGKSFDSQWGLTRHIRTHTKEKPFKCNYPGCGKCFSEKCGLKRHVSSHDHTKPYKCPHPGCDKTFKSRDYLGEVAPQFRYC